jgi:hypothetical protein
MPSLFAALDQQVSDDIDTVFAETFEIRPYATADVNAGRTPDKARPVLHVQAIFDDRYKDVSPMGSSNFVARAATPVGSTEVKLSLNLAQLGGGPAPIHGDLCVRLDTKDIYELTDPKPDGLSRMVYRLKLAGKSK